MAGAVTQEISFTAISIIIRLKKLTPMAEKIRAALFLKLSGP